MLEHASAPPSTFTLCALSAQAIHAAQGQPGRERRGWYPLGQLEEELDPLSRTGDQVVEVLHFMGGEDSPRRVLCPWRAHRLASTLPAVARATAVCFLRCECLRGRGVSRPRDPSHRWGARCSSHGCPAVFRGSQQVPQRRTDALFSRLSRPGEHLECHHPTDEQRTGYALGVAIVQTAQWRSDGVGGPGLRLRRYT